MKSAIRRWLFSAILATARDNSLGSGNFGSCCGCSAMRPPLLSRCDSLSPSGHWAFVLETYILRNPLGPKACLEYFQPVLAPPCCKEPEGAMTFETRLRNSARPLLFRGKASLLAATMLASSLAACSSVPDAVNPIEWYKGTRDLITGGDEDKAKSAPAPAASTAARNEPAGDFPSLSTVPEKPAVTPENQRALAAKGLVADAERAKYSDEEIRRDTGAGTARPQGVSVPAPTVAPSPAGVTSQQLSGGRVPPSSPPAGTMPSGRPMSAQEVFQQRIAQQNSPKLTPDMMQGFFTSETPPVTVGSKAAPAQALPFQGSTPKSISLGTAAAAIIPFEQGSADLTPAANAQLRQLADGVIAQRKRVRIAGHASNRSIDTLPGSEISAARANAVARAMIGLGVPPGQVTVMALADTQPLSNVESANRRVEIFVE
ncbi:MAG: hypothetical protein EPN20_13780 [Magnetospirillum sp.]|nr:MAG: hypothetical protein EPN20_13780 [Magnetospirillum sp.]